MCGICGFADNWTDAHVREAMLHDMVTEIRHRGPDDHGMYCNGQVALGNRRLSIIDVRGGGQPIWNEDRSVVVVFNGEIYNYRELTASLRSRGHRFITESDTEVIVHLYEELGDDCVHQLDGMFGFALWDERKQRLLIARDRLGIKPMYLHSQGGQLIFGSEIKAILRHPAVIPSLDLTALSTFLSLRYVPSPQTMFTGIEALPPGHLLTWQDGHIAIRQYWDVDFSQPAHLRAEADYAEELESILRTAVESQLVSDVPFGAFLSGGLDSSTIVALMSQYLNEPAQTFAVGYEGPDAIHSELPYARLVSDRWRTDHHEMIVRSDDFVDLAAKVIWHLDQPIADPAVITNYKVAELAATKVKMVLTGEGGDELFAGYARYSAERLSGYTRRIPAPVRALMLSGSGRLPGLRREKIGLYALCQTDEVIRFANWFPLFDQEKKAALLSRSAFAEVDSAPELNVFRKHLDEAGTGDALSRMLYLDTKLWLVDDLLARGDKMSMASSLEARVPLLDHRLVQFAAELPSRYKIRNLTRKYLLRSVAEQWLPSEILSRKKKGFPTPLSEWFRAGARTFLLDHLSPETIRRRGLFDPSYVARLLTEHDSGFADHGNLLWGLLGVELWHQQFLDTSFYQAQPDSAPAVLLVGAN